MYMYNSKIGSIMNSTDTKQFAVNWNNHMNHVKKAFDNLLNNSELTDVTLYAEGKKLEAHKILLSACSTYFRNLFREFPQEHPIVVLKGVSYSVLTDILKFIYNGEVSVDSDVFDSFLQTAEFLQISGLTKEMSNINEEVSESSTEIKVPKKEKRPMSDTEQNVQTKKVKENSADADYTSLKCEPEVLTAVFPEELTDQLQEGSQFSSELMLQEAGSNNYTVEEAVTKIEEVNSRETAEDHYYNEITSGNNITASSVYKFDESSLKCTVCNKVFSHPYSLHHHRPVHLGSTKCPICHVVLSRKYNLKMHMRSRHNIV